MEFLVVDDSRCVRKMLQSLLRELMPAARIVAVNDLESALAWARFSKGPDLVLLDLGLPGCAGLEALIRFRASFPRVPVAVVSATDDRDSIASALGAGAIGYVAKSSPRNEIMAALRPFAVAGSQFFQRFQAVAAPRELLKPVLE